jgi:hypothetical protein
MLTTMRTPSNYVCETIDPENPGGPKIGVTILASYYARLYKYSPVQYENLRAVEYVFKHPERIFWGVRVYSEGGWCYVGRPEEWCVRQGITVPFPKHLVFAVYINSRRELFEYGAEKTDPDDPLNPIDWQGRYGGLIWKSTF